MALGEVRINIHYIAQHNERCSRASPPDVFNTTPIRSQGVPPNGPNMARKWPQRASRKCPRGPPYPPKVTKLAKVEPRMALDGPRAPWENAEISQGSFMVAPREAKKAQDGHKRAQESPKMAPGGPNMAPRWPQEALRWPRPRKLEKEAAARWPQEAPRSPKKPQEGPRWIMMAEVGPRWPQVGPRSSQDGPKMGPK